MLLFLSLVAAAAAPPAYEYAVLLIFGPESPHWPQRVGETVPADRPYALIGSLRLIVEQLPRAAALGTLLLLLTRDRSMSRENDPRSRRIARALAWIALLWLVAATAVGAAMDVPRWALLGLMPRSFPQDTLHVAIVLATLGYMIHLSRRVPSPKLARYARALQWLCVPLALGWLAMSGTGTVAVFLGPPAAKLPYAFAVTGAGGPTTGPATATTTHYMVIDESLAMTRTTTAPAYMLERWEQFQHTKPGWETAIDSYSLIRRYVTLPATLWALGALVLVALLWRTLHNVVKQQRAIAAAANGPTRA